MGFALVNAITVLIIACPCALGLATSMSIIVGTGRVAQAGVRVKNAEALELMVMIDTLVVDKTGTLTEGKPRLIGIETTGGIGEDELLRLAATLERGSEHPLAEVIVKAAEARGVALPTTADFQSHTGKGVSGTVGGRSVALGNRALLQGLGIDPAPLSDRADRLRAEGQGVMIAAVGRKLAGLLVVAEPVKEGAAAAVQVLGRDGVRVIMLTATTAGRRRLLRGASAASARSLPRCFPTRGGRPSSG